MDQRMLLDPPDEDILERGLWNLPQEGDSAITPPLDSIRQAAEMSENGETGPALHAALQFLEHVAEQQNITIEEAIADRKSLKKESMSSSDLQWQSEVYENLHSSLQLPSGISQGKQIAFALPLAKVGDALVDEELKPVTVTMEGYDFQ